MRITICADDGEVHAIVNIADVNKLADVVSHWKLLLDDDAPEVDTLLDELDDAAVREVATAKLARAFADVPDVD